MAEQGRGKGVRRKYGMPTHRRECTMTGWAKARLEWRKREFVMERELVA